MTKWSHRLRWPLLIAIAAAAPLSGVDVLRAQRGADQGTWLTWGGDGRLPIATSGVERPVARGPQ